MPGHGVHANIHGVVRRLPKEVARFLNSQDWLFGGTVEDRPRVYKRRLRIEPLESRHLMDAAGAASLVSPLWFQNVAGSDASAHAGVASCTTESVGSSTGQDAPVDTGLPGVNDWIIQFNTASLSGVSSVAETASLLAGGGIEFQIIEGLGLDGMVLARSSGASLSAVRDYLSTNVNVASFERDAVGQVTAVPNDSQYSQLWGMNAIDAPDAWNISTGSSKVVVAVIDTGVDYNDRDLAANIWTNPGETSGNSADDDHNGFVDDVHGYNFVANNGDPMDDNSHGTHVSGTIGAVGNNSQGVAGVNWSCSIMPLKFLSSDGTGYLSDAIRAINYVTMERTQYGVNVRVINCSWGGGEYSAALESAIRASGDAGILFVAAAGNSATNNDTTPEYPANYTPSNVISVAAVTKTNSLASFSNYGATTVDIAAPGVSIYSTIPGNRYAIYSGTSMATPFVSGVAALAWAVDPSATVAEVRNAILEGASPVASLSGKVASGGVLNAYNTLKLLDNPAPSGPSIGSLVASPNSVAIGAAVTLSARGITVSSGTATSVSFYVDSNNNGQYDTADHLLGSTSSIAGGQAAITINSSSLGTGSHQVLARAQGSSGIWGSCVSTTLTVLCGDDHGNNAATATAVGVPSSTAGTIEVTGDSDWFKFQAVAGKHYVFNVQLGTLSDSVLYLYDTNGVAQLAFNDDYGSSSASQITWTATTSGAVYLAVGGYGNTCTGTYSMSVQMSNSAPVLTAIGSQTLSYSATTLSIPLHATDADGDSLTYTAQVMTVDRLAQRAYALDQRLTLHTFANASYHLNSHGADEKYLLSKYNVLYFIRPNGSLYRWGGSIAQSVLVDTLSREYYVNPTLLCAAQIPSLMSISSVSVETAIVGDTLIVTRAAGVTGVLRVQVTVSDGQQSNSEVFTIADSLAQKAYNLDQQLGLHTFADGSYRVNAHGVGEKYILGYNNVLYFIRPNGSLYRWGGSIAQSTLVAKLSPAYYADPLLLCDAQSPTLTATATAAAAQSVEDVAASDAAGVGVEASAEASLHSASVAVALLAIEDGSRLGSVTSGDVLASVAGRNAAPADGLAASLHDQVLALLSPDDSQTLQESPLTTLDQQFGQVAAGNQPDSETELHKQDAIDFVFDMPTETFSPLAASQFV